MDECGIEHRLYREYARVPRGERIYESVSGNAHQRTSIISASQGSKLIEPMLFDGVCTTDVVNAYFEQMLLPVLPRGSVIVLDNARFHQSTTTHELVQRFGYQPVILTCLLARFKPDRAHLDYLEAPASAQNLIPQR